MKGEGSFLKKRIENIRKKFQQVGIDALLITSPTNRRYISGFTGSTGYVLISEDRAAFITDFRYTEQATEQCKDYEIVDNKRNMLAALKETIQRFGVKSIGFEQDFVTFAEYGRLLQAIDDVKWVPTSNLIEELRLIKDADELAKIQKAIDIADEAFSHILGYIRPGVTEEEVALELEFKMRKLGASGNSFDPIVVSGERGALPHGRPSKKAIRAGELVTLDFGCVYEGYVSDITRTVAVGEISHQLREIYNICLEAQLNGVNNIKAGMTGREADALCRDVIEKAGYGAAFGHSTGHGIGLDVHEGPNASVTSEIILQPGMLLTVEPGIYLTGIGGVRIEDDIIITENGNQILSKSTKELLILG